MTEIEKLLVKYDLTGQKDKQLDIPHIMYERRGINREIVISKNFILEYKMLLQKEYIRPEDLENSFYDFEKRFFSQYFFREDTDLKWNYYLIIIVDENEEDNDDIAQLENDDKFLRKLVMTVDELEIYIGHGETEHADKYKDVTGIDTYGEWLKNLGSRNLDGILTCSYEGSKVQGYIEDDIGIRPQGRPISNWDNTESRNTKYLVEKIDSLHMEKFREHCLPENQEIKLSRVNLFSGSNGSGKSSLCAAIEYAMTGEILDSIAEGHTSVRISNREGKQAVLKSGMQPKEKKELDRLWYGTTTTAYKSNLNRHFHAFNYLGLEASGEYIANLDINELVKNVLFGTEVTEAEKKMQRYGKEFADRKRGYDKQIKEIHAAIMERAKEENTEELPKKEILIELRLLGYRDISEDEVHTIDIKRYTKKDERLSDDAFLKKLLGIVVIYQKDVNRLLELCGEEEDGRQIRQRKAELLEKKEKYHLYQENERELQFIRLKQEASREIVQKYDKKISTIRNMCRQGEGLERIFFSRWDFFEQDNVYRHNAEKKENLQRWLEEYGNILTQEKDVGHMELSQLELCIEKKQADINVLKQEIDKIVKEIDAQKALRESLDSVIQEIHALSERYINSYPDVAHCPVCGAQYRDNDALAEAIREHKKYENADNELLQLLLNTRWEKKQAVAAENDSLREMMREKALVQKRQTAIAKLKSVMDIGEHKQGDEIVKTVGKEIEKLQNWLNEHEKVYAYAKMVQGSDELAEYDGSLEWMEYLDRAAGDLKREIEKETKQIKEQEARIQELLQQTAEEGIFSEKEWETCQLKSFVYENLIRGWNIAENMPLVQWAKDFRNFTQKVEYAQELYKRQREYIDGQMYMEKLQKDKEQLEKKSRKCQEAYELIDSQRKLEDIMMDFLSENEKQIELFFKLLHRPKEFGTLKICDGKISIVRNSNGKTVECTQMSTGQRMALAFSIMITLHKNAPNAPKFLMLDEPVANLDDMHVLNLIDLLRELAISGTQIILTTADNQMAKYLRRKFSCLQREYTHFELIRKGSEKTYLKENHYSPEKKVAID